MNRRYSVAAIFCMANFTFLSFVFFLSIFLLSTFSLPVKAQANSIKSLLHKHGEVIVRVYFDDEDNARKFGLGLEPMQSNYEKGYLVFHLTNEEYKNLNNIVKNNGMRIELDTELNEKYITNRQPRLPQAATTLRQASPLQSVDSQLQALALEVENYPTIPGFACYRTVEGTFQTAQDIVTNYPNLATWNDVGDSWEKENGLGGYDMMVLKLTNAAISGSKPKIFFTSAIHAREYTTAELMTRFAVQLVQDYGNDADTTWILDHHEVHLMLVTNPDGRKRAETGILWRKNVNTAYCGPTSNSRGADLNRNFDYRWNCCGGSSSDQCDQTYHGSGPGSEPEVQTVMNYLRNNFPDLRDNSLTDAAPEDAMGIYFDIHSSGRLVLWPWGFTSDPAPNGTALQTLGRKIAYFNNHTPEQAIGLYPTDGTTISFAYGDLGLPAFLFELGTEFFESCSYFENTLLPANLPSLFYAIKAGRAAYKLPGGPDVINQTTFPTTATGVPAGTIVTLSATATDQRFNNSNGSEPTQNIVSAEYFIDELPWSGAASGSPMSVADGSFNSGMEGIEASIDTTGLTEGRHTVYIQATDSAGNTGVISAVFLDIDNSAVLPTIIFADDFETDKGWSANPAGSDTATTGQWQRANPEDTNSGGPQQLGATVSGSIDLVTGPLAGTSVGAHDIDNGVTSIRSPDIVIPAASSVNLSFYYYLAHLNNATTADFFRASIVSSAGTSQVLQELGDASQDNAAWEQQSFDISAFADDTIYILFEAADAGGASLVEAAVDDVEITAVLGNQPPVVTDPGDQSTVEGTNVSLQIDASDAENDPLAYSANNLPGGLSINNSTGLISGAVTASPQVFNSSVDVNDGANITSVSFDWTITPDNDSPVITNPGDQTNLENDVINLQIIASDADGDPLNYSASGLPVGLSINATTGEISGVLGFASANSYTVTVTVTDTFFAPSVTFDWLVNNVNRAPIFDTAVGNQSSNEGDTVSLQLQASDDDGDPLTYSATGLPPGLSLNSTSGLISGSLNFNSTGSYIVDLSVSDGGSSDTMSFEWRVFNVNQPPNVTNPSNQISQPTDVVSLQIIASDDDGDLLSYSATGLPPALSIDAPTGLITGTITAAAGNSYNVIVSVDDGTDISSTSFVWGVTGAVACVIYDSVDIPVALPNGTASISSTIVVPAGGNISELNVDVDMSHAWVGDLSFTLNHQNSATSVSMMDRPGVPANTYGCSNDNILARFTDAAVQDVESLCLATTPTISGDVSPDNPLSAFNNKDAAGTWELTVVDAYPSADSGILNNWSMEICTGSGSNIPPSVTNPGDQTSAQFDNVSVQIMASDPNGDVMTYSATGLPQGLSVNASTGEISGSVTAALADYPVQITVSDGQQDTTISLLWSVISQNNQVLIYLSSTTDGSVDGIAFSDEDILVFNASTNSWQMHIDGSDVGLGSLNSQDINAFTVLNDDSIVFSVAGATTLPNVGSVDDSDLIRFIPTSTGDASSGSFELYFDGSDVGLSSNGENIDSVNILSSGDILISTLGSYGVAGISGSDEDLMRFTPTSLGATTSGIWSAYFDGSDVDLGGVSTEDVYAAWVDDVTGDIYLSTRGAFSVTGLSGDGADIFICTPTSVGITTSCSYSSFWDGSAFGYGTEAIDGVSIQR